MLDEMGFRPDKVEVRTLPLGTDPDRFVPGLDGHVVRARYGLGERPWLLTVARLAAHKGIDTGIEVLGGAPGKSSGSGVRGRRARREAGGPRIAGPPARSRRSRAILASVPDADLPALYNGAALYLGLSRPEELLIEGFGISLTEASACGIPVLGGRAGGIPDAVRDGETGILVDSTDPGAVLAAVRSLLDDPALRARLGQAGRLAVESHYNWDRVTREVRQLGQDFGVPGPTQ